MGSPRLHRPVRALYIGIDAHVVGRGKGGAETYCEQLVTALAASESDDTYTVFLAPQGRELAERVRASNVRYEVVDEPNLVIQRFVRLPARAHALGLDVLHVQRVVPPLARAARVVTIHDLAHTMRPDLFDAREGFAIRRLVAMSARRAHRILTDSAVSRDDIVQQFGVASDRLAVVPLGVDHFAAGSAARASSSGSGGGHLLCVGAIETRKNLTRLLDAYALVESGSGGIPPLVIAGPSRTPGLLQQLLAYADKLGIAPRVRFAGHVDAVELQTLFADARAFVFPSLFEGFGLPPLEALAYGLPVAVSDIPVHREMLADAALYFDPLDTAAMADALRAVSGDEGLRRVLTAKGPSRASQYTWSRTAALTREAYADAVRERETGGRGWEQ